MKEEKKTKVKSKVVKPKKPKAKKLVESLIGELLAQLKTGAKVTLSEDKEGTVQVQLETEDPGALIGFHGETLASLQLILGMMVYRQTGQWTRVLVNVNDYREKRQESLERMALSAAQKVKFSGEAQALPPMSPAERRIIHLALAGDPEVATESEGEDYHRRVVIKPKK